MQFLGPALNGMYAKGDGNLFVGINLSGMNFSGSGKISGFLCATNAGIKMEVPLAIFTPS